jgi:uncharacterized protein YxeA
MMKKILIILLSLILCLSCACSENKTAEEPPQVQVSEDEMKTVYITKSGSKYHSYGCTYLKKSCIEKDLSTIEMQGYTPCSVCQ